MIEITTRIYHIIYYILINLHLEQKVILRII